MSSAKPLTTDDDDSELTLEEQAMNDLADEANGWGGGLDAKGARIIREKIHRLEKELDAARQSSVALAAEQWRAGVEAAAELAQAYPYAPFVNAVMGTSQKRTAQHAASNAIAAAIRALLPTPPTEAGEPAQQPAAPLCTCGRFREGTRLTQNHERGCPMAQQPAAEGKPMPLPQSGESLWRSVAEANEYVSAKGLRMAFAALDAERAAHRETIREMQGADTNWMIAANARDAAEERVQRLVEALRKIAEQDDYGYSALIDVEMGKIARAALAADQKKG